MSGEMTPTFVRVAAALLGATGIVAAAFGAHGLEKIADARGVRLWAIACAIQLVTAPVILWTSGELREGRLGALSPLGLLLGVLIFSGTLYAMALGAPRFLGAITPLGGLLLALAWLSLAF
mgnify:CR=1 FL=1|jgi:uncharacterized membrane protein YgdD (TMEM256/DUF423 family)